MYSMNDSKINSEQRAKKNTIIILLCLFGILASLGSSALSAEQQEVKPKKPRFELSEKTLVDNKTRLMWPLNGHLAEQTVSWNGASEYIAGLNDDVYGGHQDWRLPSREELATLVEHVKSQGFGRDPDRTVAAGLHALGMKNINNNEYWTSTELLYNSGEAWFVNMSNGGVGKGMKTLYFSLLPVRSLP